MSFPRLTMLDTGYCVHPEHVVMRNRRLRPMKFPAMFALIEHPRVGPILFDTGYSQRFVELTRRWPERLYTMVTPVTVQEEEFAVARLAARGIAAGDVRFIVASHFHADHVGGLGDFPFATYLYFKQAWTAVAKLRGIRALRRGYLPGLIPAGFESRSRAIETESWVPLPSECAPFDRGVDLFDDETLFAVLLAGHATGQLGLLVRTGDRAWTFLVADACWTRASYREQVMPHPITRLLFDDRRQYRETLRRLGELHRLAPEITIVPSHCSETHRRLVSKPAATSTEGQS